MDEGKERVGYKRKHSQRALGKINVRKKNPRTLLLYHACQRLRETQVLTVRAGSRTLA